MKVYYKLVRDNIPNIISEKGIKLHYHTVKDDEQFYLLLGKKLKEEVEEYLQAKPGSIESLEELADIAEIIESMMDIKKISKKDLLTVINYKRLKNGSFINRVFLEDVEE